MTSSYDTGVRVVNYWAGADEVRLRQLAMLIATTAPQQVALGDAGEGALHVWRDGPVSFVMVAGEPLISAWVVEGAPSLTAIRDEYLFCLDEGAGE